MYPITGIFVVSSVTFHLVFCRNGIFQCRNHGQETRHVKGEIGQEDEVKVLFGVLCSVAPFFMVNVFCLPVAVVDHTEIGCLDHTCRNEGQEQGLVEAD